MRELSGDKELFEENDTEIVAILADAEKGAKQLEGKCTDCSISLAFDPDKKAASFFHQEFKLLKLGRMPALFIVDKEGIIRYAHHGNSMSDIPSNQELLAFIKQLEK